MFLIGTAAVIFLVVLANALFWPRVGGAGPWPAHRVSILIPARNEESNIAECIQRALEQGASVHEILIYDDHSEDRTAAIVTESAQAADAFVAGVDAAAVYVNASTRFTDGFEYGMGAEIGNSTQKLHARGPIGMRELTTTKYVGRGSGQVRG